MIVICNRSRPLFLIPLVRRYSSSLISRFSTRSPFSLLLSSRVSGRRNEKDQYSRGVSDLPILENQQAPPPPRAKFAALSATLVSTAIASYVLVPGTNSDRAYYDLHRGDERTSSTFGKIVEHLKHTASAVCVLCQSLCSVLSSANHEVRTGFELRVASFLADMVAANESRRTAIVNASGGAVLDWLLQIIAFSCDSCGTQSESARALAHLIADPNACAAVLARPHAVPNLLRFIFSFQPKHKNRHTRNSWDSPKGRSMLVAAIMDVVTSSCGAQPRLLLSGIAETGDIASAIRVIEEGGTHFEDCPHDGAEEDDPDHDRDPPGLWDDLHSDHVAVPFAAWALANWADSRAENRAAIADLDRDGRAVATALTASERTVKWHGSLLARSLLDDPNVPDATGVHWTTGLLSTASQASKIGDVPLVRLSLSAFVSAVRRSDAARSAAITDGALPLMMETAARTSAHLPSQESLAESLHLLLLLPGNPVETRRWSGVLLSWIFGKPSSDVLRSSAVKTLTSVLEHHGPDVVPVAHEWLFLILNASVDAASNLKAPHEPDAAGLASAASAGLKALADVLSAADTENLLRNRISDLGILHLLRRFLLHDDYEKLAAAEAYNASVSSAGRVRVPPTRRVRRRAARLLTLLSTLDRVKDEVAHDASWCGWLEDCASGNVAGCSDAKTRSYCRAALLNVSRRGDDDARPHYLDGLFLVNPGLPHWESSSPGPSVDVVFVHGLRGGPFKTWRIADDDPPAKSALVERVDQEAGKHGTFWPGEWLSSDVPDARLFTLKYKTNLTQWSGASLPLQEVSAVLLDKLLAAGIGTRPVVFVTHSMGGLVVKQMLYKAKEDNVESLVRNTAGVVFYSCPHFGSKLADMPWRMGMVLRPAPSIGELRSGSLRLMELNDFVRCLQKKGHMDVLSFCETKVTPIVEGYGGWAFRMEIVPIESAYPGFGQLVVLESTDHINSCKPVDRDHPSYKEMLSFVQKVKAKHAGSTC